ncbi:MAG: hypothetical protein ABIG71_02670 [Candidatus Uhrbacteria bacterium]
MSPDPFAKALPDVITIEGELGVAIVPLRAITEATLEDLIGLRQRVRDYYQRDDAHSPKYLSLGEACALLQCTPEELLARDDIEKRQVGRTWIIAHESVVRACEFRVPEQAPQQQELEYITLEEAGERAGGVDPEVLLEIFPDVVKRQHENGAWEVERHSLIRERDKCVIELIRKMHGEH